MMTGVSEGCGTKELKLLQHDMLESMCRYVNNVLCFTQNHEMWCIGFYLSVVICENLLH
jgi:hypothetical protein